jgi:hypothetical protein
MSLPSSSEKEAGDTSYVGSDRPSCSRSVYLKALIIINASEEKPDDSYSPKQKSK